MIVICKLLYKYKVETHLKQNKQGNKNHEICTNPTTS